MAEQKRGGPRGHGPQGHGFQRPKDFRGTVSKLLRYIGRYKAALVVVFICLVISSVGSVMSSYLLKPIINDYILPGDFAGLLKMLALLLGLFMGVMELIPYIGPFIAGVPAVLLALQSGWTAALWTLLAICLVQQVEANLLSPRLLSGATRLHPLAVLLAIAFGGMAGGVVGMMAALPLVVCVRGAVRGWRE